MKITQVFTAAHLATDNKRRIFSQTSRDNRRDVMFWLIGVVRAVFCWHEVVCSCCFFRLKLCVQFAPPPAFSMTMSGGFQVGGAVKGVRICFFGLITVCTLPLGLSVQSDLTVFVLCCCVDSVVVFPRSLVLCFCFVFLL